MMLLTETINNCTTAIQHRRAAQENKQSAEAYARALALLNTASEGLKATLKCASAIKERGLVSQPLMTARARDDLLDCANNCGQGLYDGTLTEAAVAIMKTKSESYSGQVQIVWKDAAQKYAEGTLGYLSLIGGLSNNPQKSNELLERIKKLIDGRLSIDTVDALVDYVAQAKAITDSFSLNDSIEAFLKKVSSRQATILDLTPEVQEWLSEKQLSAKLKISF